MARSPADVPGPGTLLIVATPIGNLGDMTSRAVESLRGAAVILAEDTRTSRVLLDRFGITTPVLAAHEHNEARIVPDVLARLGRGEQVALITDAGTPLISDPGGRIVRAVREAGFRVSPIPGPSALIAALSAAGLDTSRFTFYGFLERSGRERQEAIEAISGSRHTSVLYEAANRVAATLKDLGAAVTSGRRAVVAREITKIHEEFREGTVADLAAYYADHPPRGEVVIVLAGMEAKPFNEDELRDRVNALRAAGVSARDVAAQLAAETGVARNTIYRMAVRA